MTYASKDEADVYHAARHNTVWAALSDNAKQARLLMASDYLDAAYRYKYAKTDPTQTRQFPRKGMTDIPPEIKQAVIILAGDMGFSGSLTAAKTQQRNRVKVGELEVEYAERASSSLTDYALIDGLLRDWIIDPNLRFGAITVGVMR